MPHHQKQLSSSWQGIESLEPRLLLAGDLTVAIGALPTDIPTGYALNVPITVTNNDLTKVSGPTTFTVSLNDGNGYVTIGSKTITGSIAAGATINVIISTVIPSDTAIVTDTLRVTTVAGVLTSNTPTATPDITWDFGNLPGLGNVTCTAVDPMTGATGVFSLTGPGMGSLFFNGPSPTGYWDMSLTGTTRATKITIKGVVDLEQIEAPTMVGSISAPQTDFVAAPGFENHSWMNFEGGILALTMHDVSPLAATGRAIYIDKGDLAKDALAMKFNNVSDLVVDSQMPISSFTAASYTANIGTPQIRTSAYIGNVAIAGNFIGRNGCHPEFYATGANPANGFGIANISVGGNMDASEFHADYGNIGPVKIGGYMDHGAEVYADYGSVGNVWVGGAMDNSSEIYSNCGGIGTVHVGGHLDNYSEICVNNQGNIGAVWIGGNMDRSSYIYIGKYGNVASVTIKGNLDNSAEIDVSESGNIGLVSIGGNMNHDAEVYTGYGNIAGVKIGGSLDNGAEVYISGAGNIGPVTIGGNLDNGAEVYSYMGNIASAKITGNLDNGAYIETSRAGNIGTVTIGGNMDRGSYVEANGAGSLGALKVGGDMDHGAFVYVDYGNIGSVTVGRNLDNGAYVEAYYGKVGTAHIGKNMDNGASVYSDQGAVGDVWVGGDFSNGAQVGSYGASLKSMKVLGNSLGASDKIVCVKAYTTIGSISIGGYSTYADFEAGGSIGSISVGGLMQNGLVRLYNGGNLGSMSVGQLDATVLKVGANAPLTGSRNDFYTQSSWLGTLTITGVKAGGVTNYITGDSTIAAWQVGKIVCKGPSTGGSSAIEYHTGSVSNLPVGVTRTVVA
jgi:hypothetical protein